MSSRGEAYAIVTLANGARSLYSHVHDEIFHPVIGPRAEAEALYVRQVRLLERLRGGTGAFVIWDVGLGAAANVLTALGATRGAPRPLHIVSFDHTLEPLRFALRHASDLGYFGGYERVVARRLARPEGLMAFVDGARRVVWDLRLGDFSEMLQRTSAAASLPVPDAILYDPFSPARNPAMWTLPLFERIYARLDPGRPCVLPTYSRSTMLRVTLLLAGFFVGVGHATGEKEETTMAANTLALVEEPLDREWLARVRRSTSAEPLREAVYRQCRLSAETWERLLTHRQFA